MSSARRYLNTANEIVSCFIAGWKLSSKHLMQPLEYFRLRKVSQSYGTAQLAHSQRELHFPQIGVTDVPPLVPQI